MPPQIDSSTRMQRGRGSFLAVLRACIPGLLILGYAGYKAQQLRTELETWPTVQAHVDNAVVIAWHVATRQASYAKRLWLTYSFNGRIEKRRLDGTYSNNWAQAAHAVDDVKARGMETLLINPTRPSDVTLDPGYTFDFFVWPAVLAGMGITVLAIGFGAGMAARRGVSSQQSGRGGRTKPAVASPAFVAVIGVLFAATGIAILVHNVRQRVEWVAVTARVDSADVVQRRSDRHGTLYTPRLWIAYERGGRTYHRPVLTGAAWVRDPISTQHDAEVAWHAGPTKAFVNPSDPYQATLDPTSGGNMLLPIIFTLVGFGLLALARYRSKGKPRAAG